MVLEVNKMVEFEAYDIDNIEYLVLDKLELDGETYLFLSNSKDPEDIMFRKYDKNDLDYIIPLDNEEEVKKVATAFNER